MSKKRSHEECNNGSQDDEPPAKKIKWGSSFQWQELDENDNDDSEENIIKSFFPEFNDLMIESEMVSPMQFANKCFAFSDMNNLRNDTINLLISPERTAIYQTYGNDLVGSLCLENNQNASVKYPALNDELQFDVDDIINKSRIQILISGYLKQNLFKSESRSVDYKTSQEIIDLACQYFSFQPKLSENNGFYSISNRFDDLNTSSVSADKLDETVEEIIYFEETDYIQSPSNRPKVKTISIYTV